MAIVSAGYAGTVNDAQWALMSRFFGQDFGVLNLNELNCTQQSGAKTFNISAGTFYGRGIMDISDASVNIAPSVPVSGGQWFLIIARRIWATKVTSLMAIAGPTTTATPPTSKPASYPTLQRNPGVQDDQPLWWVWVNASNTTTVKFDQRIFSSGRVADFNAIPPTGFLTRGSQLTVEPVRMTLADNGTAWEPITLRVSGATALRNQLTSLGLAVDGMEWHDTDDNGDYVNSGGVWKYRSGFMIAYAQRLTGTNQEISTKTAITGMSASFTLPSEQEVEFRVAIHGYGSTADVLAGINVVEAGVNLSDWIITANSGGQATYNSHTLTARRTLPAGVHSVSTMAARAAGSGNMRFPSLTDTGNCFLSIVAI